MDVIWIISLKNNNGNRGEKTCVLRPTSQTSYVLSIRFFTVNNQVIFLKCIFEFVFNTVQSALNGVSMLSFFIYLLFCFICLFVVQLLYFFYSYIFFCLLASFPSFLYLWPLPSASQTECPSPWGRLYWSSNRLISVLSLSKFESKFLFVCYCQSLPVCENSFLTGRELC